MSISPSVPHLVSRPQRATIDHHGLYLVPDTNRRQDSEQRRSNFFYRIAAVGAALFLAMTVC